MPRRSMLTAADRENLLSLPQSDDELIRHYTFSETDRALIRLRRGDANRLGFAVQLCLLRFPGHAMAADREVPDMLIHWVAKELWLDTSVWEDYGERAETRREHLLTLRAYLELAAFTRAEFRRLVRELTDTALQIDKGIVLATRAVEIMRQRQVVIPPIMVIDRACSQALALANRRLYRQLIDQTTETHRLRLDELLDIKPGTGLTWLVWLRQSPLKPNSRYMLEHIARLRCFQGLELPEGIGRDIHQNRLLKIAREGAQMSPQDLRRFEADRRHATLVAVVLEASATVTDEIIDLHDRIMTKLFATARNKHKQKFQSEGKAINEKVRLYSAIGRALLQAKDAGTDAFDAIEQVIPWDDFIKSVNDANQLARPGSFDHLHLVDGQFPTLRRYTPQFLSVLTFEAARAAQPVLDAVNTLRAMNAGNTRTVPTTAPTTHVKPRWRPLVFKDGVVDRRYYEICTLSELKNSLRSGDIWVKGSRQFRNFDDYLISKTAFAELSRDKALPVAIHTDGEHYLGERLAELEKQLALVSQLAKDNELPDAVVNETGLKLTPHSTTVPDEAQRLIDQISQQMPRVKITELLMDVDDWTGFTRHFVNLKSGDPTKERTLLLSAILADAINLGLTKMAESSPGTTYSKLSWLQAWHIRDETYSSALAELVNTQLANPFAEHWGDGTTSSSDGQRFRTGSHGENTGHVNPKYGSEPGRQFYTHISDQYAPFSTKVINVGIRDSTYVLDGLLYHESDLRIEEHYTDTAVLYI